MNLPVSQDLAMRLTSGVETASVKPGHGPLLMALEKALPDLAVKLVYTRGGWHLPGGVVDAHGNRVAASLSEWLQSEADGDVLDLYMRYEDKGLLATKLCGKTHYFTVKTGGSPWDFIQVEVDELREITDRELLEPGNAPDSVEELMDPVDPIKVDPTALGPAYYRLRQAFDIQDAHARMTDSVYAENLLVLRFVDDWLASSANGKRDFCSKFVLKMTEYRDRFGERRLQATPLPTHARALPPLPSGTERGVELSRFLSAFDRAVGYPMAWYFHMTSGVEPALRGVAHAVFEDVQGAYDYLPARDVQVLTSWIQDPYMF